MMDGGQPDPKRPRLSGPSPSPWHMNAEGSRQLPPPPPQVVSYPQHNPAFARPEPQSYPGDRDRRPSDHSPYESQDARRPSSGTAHGYHATPPPLSVYTAPREPMVKRDPSDEPSLQYRAPSTVNGPDGHMNQSPHHDSRFQPPPTFEPARQPTPYAQGAYQPQTPGSMTGDGPFSQHGYGNSGLPHSRSEPFATVTYPSRAAEQQVRKKAQRAAQACDSCRSLKAKCDEGRPSCSTCKEKQQECRYRDPPPKQQDKASADIMDSIGRLESTMNGFMTRILDELNVLKASPSFSASPGGSGKPGRVKQERQEPSGDIKPIHHDQRHRSLPLPDETTNRPVLQSPILQPRPAQDDYRSAEADDTEDEEASVEGNEEKRISSIPVNHTTGAARLLMVPPIKQMCEDIIKSEKIKNSRFPITQENRRGLLRLFGRGEGNENAPMYDKEPTVDLADMTPVDAHSDVSSPAAGEEWGQLGGLSPPGMPPQEITRGCINPEGMPDFSRDTVVSLVQVYKDEINNMHPILVPKQLDALVESFLKSIPESQVRSKQIQHLLNSHNSYTPYIGPPGFVGSNSKNPESPGTKRKRSSVGGEYPEPRSVLDHKPGHPSRSIAAAIVMLCMALGKICSHKGKIPCTATDYELDAAGRSSSYGSSPLVRNGYPPSPLQSSPVMTAPHGDTPPQDHDRGQPGSRRQSIDGMFGQRSSHTRPRNIDVIPGLAYFAFATDIIGNQLGGNSLQHVHANILAGLYHGQLARVMESHAYIAAACRALQVILRPRLDRFKTLKANSAIAQPKDNPLIYAFWTCLQLESDIVAELPCPRSGILMYEDDMPGPNMAAAVEDGFDPKVVESYYAQLFLRKHLNQLHDMFYKPKMLPVHQAMLASKETEHFPTIEASQSLLASIDVCARNMVWNYDSGDIADNILDARLRAKYYGAEVITYRTFILPILDPKGTWNYGIADFPAGAYVPDASKISSLADINPKVREYIVKGLKALIFSTTAFHGLSKSGQERPIVTNIWGTAHAQWGNMLTLQACYLHPILGQILHDIITREDMVRLLEKTLAFLALVATPTSALELDRKILDFTARKNGFLPRTAAGSSFSSNMTGDTTGGY